MAKKKMSMLAEKKVMIKTENLSLELKKNIFIFAL